MKMFTPKNIGIFIICFGVGMCMICVYILFMIHQTPPSPLHEKFSLRTAPEKSLSASIISSSGKVEWESRVASDSVPLQNTQKIQQGETVSTLRNGKLQLAFLGKALVTLSQNTTVALIQTLPASIVLSQNAGSATYSTTGSSPLAVRSLSLLAQSVKAGNFSVLVNSATVTVSVTTGSVQLAFTDDTQTSNTMTVVAGQTMLFDDNAKTLIKE